jgi:NAD(P)-dependent dehydrogenase (short-subunit alcohol dehydrogenase family)
MSLRPTESRSGTVHRRECDGTADDGTDHRPAYDPAKALPDRYRHDEPRDDAAREAYMLYGASKAAAEAATAVMSADLARTGVTANVLVRGVMRDTRIVPDAAVADRGRLLRPESMGPPLLRLVSNAAAGVTGRRSLAAHWEGSLPAAEAAEKCGAPTAWKSIATMPIEPD